MTDEEIVKTEQRLSIQLSVALKRIPMSSLAMYLIIGCVMAKNNRSMRPAQARSEELFASFTSSELGLLHGQQDFTDEQCWAISSRTGSSLTGGFSPTDVANAVRGFRRWRTEGMKVRVQHNSAADG